MSEVELRHDKPYRRGLVLGLTMAETMILVVFALLLALTTSLSVKDERIAQLEKLMDKGLATQLFEVVQRQYPSATTFDDYFKELKTAFDAAERMKVLVAESGDQNSVLEDARIGQKVRQAAEAAGVPVDEYAKTILDTATSQKKGGWPPFINLSEAGGYFFKSGSAQLQPEFQKALETKTIDTLKGIIDQYDVNVVEVIGHTDEVPMKGPTNLDSRLIAASRGNDAIASLASSDNAGLGMARAVSVVKVLRADPRLARITILPLSGAQMIVPIDQPADGTQVGDIPSRRRIEIRLRKSTGETTVKP